MLQRKLPLSFKSQEICCIKIYFNLQKFNMSNFINIFQNVRILVGNAAIINLQIRVRYEWFSINIFKIILSFLDWHHLNHFISIHLSIISSSYTLLFKIITKGLYTGPWPVWVTSLGIIPWSKRSSVQFWVRAHAPVEGSFLQGVYERQPIDISLSHWCFSPVPSPSLPLSLKINK